jgi:hypothetical protein
MASAGAFFLKCHAPGMTGVPEILVRDPCQASSVECDAHRSRRGDSKHELSVLAHVNWWLREPHSEPRSPYVPFMNAVVLRNGPFTRFGCSVVDGVNEPHLEADHAERVPKCIALLKEGLSRAGWRFGRSILS